MPLPPNNQPKGAFWGVDGGCNLARKARQQLICIPIAWKLEVGTYLEFGTCDLEFCHDW